MARLSGFGIGFSVASLTLAACGTTEAPDDTQASVGISATLTADDGASDGIDDGIDDDGGGDGEKLDLSSGTDLGQSGDCGSGGGGMMTGDPEFSYIWIANSPAGTVSKIDTTTGVEVGRYYTGPTNGNDDPSRTSVNLAGDVAVTNRSGSMTKIAAREESCIDSNNNGTIETSTGPNNVLPFGQDECVLWTIALPNGGGNQTGPRPTAWDTGDDGNPCTTADDRVWVGYFNRGVNEGHFFRLDGATGDTLDEVIAPNWDVTGGKNYGPYGGATDADGNFWVTGLSGPLVRIDGESLAVQQWEAPAGTGMYGMTLDADGHPWTAGLNGELTHFDPATLQFDVYSLGSNALRGLQIDRDGFAWVAVNGQCGLAKFDVANRTVVNANIPLPGCATPVGVSIDVEGFVWVPDQGADLAFKVDPNSFATTVTMGLTAPYTYSDMTGAGLGLVINPPTG